MCLPQQLSLPTQFLINLSHLHKYTPAFKTLSKAWCVSLWHGNHNSYIKGILLRSNGTRLYCHFLLLYVLSVFLKYDGQWVSGPTEHPLYEDLIPPLHSSHFMPSLCSLSSAPGFSFPQSLYAVHTHTISHLASLIS